MAEGSGNINLTMSLNTSPATQSLQKYYDQLNRGGKEAAASQRPVGTELARLVKAAKQLGITYDKTSKSFKNAKGIAISFKEVSRRVKELNDGLQVTGKDGKKALDGIAGGLKNVLQGIPQGIGLAIGNQILAPLNNFGAAIKQVAKESVGAFTDVDRALRITASITNEGDAAYQKLIGSIKELAAASKFTTGELSEAATGLARAGFSADEIAEALPGISKGAAAAGSDMREMSDVVIASLGGFQISTEETGSVVDVLTAAANNANTNVVELGEGLKYVGPIAKNLGLSLEDTAAVAGLLANNGIKASQMGTALRQGLSRLGAAAAGTEAPMGDLARGTANQAAVMQRLGVELKTAQGTLVPFPELLSRLRDGFSKLSSVEQGQAAKILFGQEAGSAFVSLLATSADEAERFFDITNNADGTAAETAANNLKGLAGSLDLLASATNALFTDLGEALGAFIKPAVDGLTAVVNAFNNLPDPVKDTVFAVTALAASFGLVVAGVAIFKGLAAAGLFATLGGAVAAAGAAMKAAVAPTLALAAAIGAKLKAALVAAGAQMVKFAATVLATSGNPFKLLLSGLEAGLGGILNLTKGINALTVKNAIAGWATGASKGLNAVAAGAIKVGPALLGTAGTLGILAAGGTAVFAVFDTLKQIFGPASEEVKKVEANSDSLAESFEKLTGKTQDAGDALTDTDWETSVKRVGAFRAGIDKINKALGIQTAEQAQLNTMTIELSKSVDKMTSQQLEMLQALDKEEKILQSLTPGTEEYKAQLDKVQEGKKALKKSIDDLEAQLKAVAKKYELTGKAVKDMTEEEKMLNNAIEVGLGVLKTYSGALDDIGESADKAAESLKRFSKEEMVKRAKEAAEEAKDAFELTKDEFEKNMDAMEQAFENLQEEFDKGLELEVKVKETLIQDVQKSAEAAEKRLKSRASSLEKQNEQDQQYTDSQIQLLNDELDTFEQTQNGKIAKVEATTAANIAASDRYFDNETKKLDDLAAATAAAFDARSNAIETSANKQISAIEAGVDRAKNAHDQTIANIDREERAQEQRFDNEERNAERAHEAVMRGYDEQLDQIDRLTAAQDERFDAAFDRLAEMTPAEKKLHDLKIQQLKDEAREGGEDGLRAQAQLERMARDEQAAELRKQQEQERRQAEEARELIERQRQEVEIAHEQVMESIAIRRANYQADVEQRRLAAANALAIAEEKAAADIQKIQESAAEKQAELAQQRLEAEQELSEDYEELEQDRADKRAEIEAKAAAKIAKLEEDIVEAREDTADKTKELVDNRAKREEAFVKEIEQIEKDIVDLKEGTKAEVERIEGEIQTLKDEHLADDIEREGTYQEARVNALIAYRDAVGETHTDIVDMGVTAWTTYANNAISQINRIVTALANVESSKANLDSLQDGGGGGGTPVVKGRWGPKPENAFTGGPVTGATPYTVNEFGQEAFLSKSGELSMINTPAWGVFRPREDGTILNAAITKQLGLPQLGSVNLGSGAAVTGNASGISAATQANNMSGVVNAIKSAMGGDNIVNNVTVQSRNTSQTASDMLVSLTKVKNRRFR